MSVWHIKITLLTLLAVYSFSFVIPISAQDSTIIENQEKILSNLEEQKAIIGTTQQDLKQFLSNTSNSLWISSFVAILISIGVAILTILLSAGFSIQSVQKDVGKSKKYLWGLIVIGVVVGILIKIAIEAGQTILTLIYPS